MQQIDLYYVNKLGPNCWRGNVFDASFVQTKMGKILVGKLKCKWRCRALIRGLNQRWANSGPGTPVAHWNFIIRPVEPSQ